MTMKKKILAIVIVVIVVAGTIVGTLKIVGSNAGNGTRQEELELQQKHLRRRYARQNIVFASLTDVYVTRRSSQYLPVNIERPNIDGIDLGIHWWLTFYERETGNILTYEQVLDYLSQEFEDDGEVRIFTNGRHPEIAEFIDWAYDFWNSEDMHAFISSVTDIFDAYFDEREGTPRFASIFLISVEMLDELLKKESDPDYELDLTSIQNRYIVDGRAVVSEDGRSIEFIVPDAE